RESAAHFTVAWVQVSRISICTARHCVSTVTCGIRPPGSLRRSDQLNPGLACAGYFGNPRRNSGNLGFQHLWNGGLDLWLLSRKPLLTPGYARFVRRRLFYPDCLRTPSSDNSRRGISL